VREQVAEPTAAQGRIVVLDALLKLRQVCCDPRLVKLPSARAVESSSKLDELLEMITE
jgi:SNF2 family DNA or RNA helicase